MFPWADFLLHVVTRKVSNKAKTPDRLRDEPLGDTAPASHGDATAAAPTAIPVRPPRVPVVSTGSLKNREPTDGISRTERRLRSLPGYNWI